MKKVSIIVPAYNAKNTLIQCVGNLVNQTLQDIEIILVNDCSTDTTPLIMELLKEKFPDKIIVVDCPVNQGAGGARNEGLKVATGKYIGFVDSDDIVDTTMFEKMYNKAEETGYDIIDCGFYNEKDDLAIIFTSDELTGILDAHKRNELIASGGYVFTKLFRRDFIKSHDFTFRKNVILEDSEIIAYAFATAASIGNVKEVLYIYKNNANSLSKLIEPQKYYQSCYNAMKAIYEKLSILPVYSSIKESLEYEMLQMYSYAVNCCLILGRKVENFNVINALSSLSEFRNKYISPGYNNKYVKNKISSKDIEIMKLNDSSPIKLLNSVK
ncbi:MAG: glycosyltransferase [Lachnospiraceae bacterium]|nr:glycosyltransferase [Lachnospiraceae bacterium]